MGLQIFGEFQRLPYLNARLVSLKKSRVNHLIYCYLVIMCLCMLVFILVDRRFARSFKRYAQSSRFGAT